MTRLSPKTLGVMKAYAFIALFLFISGAAWAQSLADVQQSHIEANVPPSEDFDGLLQRDLLAYFRSSGAPTATRVEYQLLRSGPTQSGVAFPKYYLWARVSSGPTLLVEGAVRVAAMERKRFEVKNFMSKDAVRAAPSDVGTIFPAALAPAVLSLAGIK